MTIDPWYVHIIKYDGADNTYTITDTLGPFPDINEAFKYKTSLTLDVGAFVEVSQQQKLKLPELA
jgi:hypothetical protein